CEGVRQGQLGEPGSEDEDGNGGHLGAEVKPFLCRQRKQTESGHRLVGQARAAPRVDALEKLSSRQPQSPAPHSRKGAAYYGGGSVNKRRAEAPRPAAVTSHAGSGRTS